MMNKRCLITAPLGATFKALFTNEDFFGHLRKRFDEIHVITTLSPEDVRKVMEGSDDEGIVYHYYRDHKLSFWPRVCVQVSFLSFGLCYDLNVFKIKMSDGNIDLSQKILNFFLKLPAIIFGYKRIFRFSEKMKYRWINDVFIRDILDKVRPNVVMASAVSFAFDYPVIAESVRKGIPVVGMVHSWDNITTKGPVYYDFDKIIVWNEFQKDELIKYYNYPVDRIVMTGIPQVDLLIKNKTKYNKDQLYKSLGIKPGTKLISYMTIAPRLCPFDNELVKLILKKISKTLKRPWHLRVRLHPQDKLEYYKSLERDSRVSFELVSDKSKRVLDGMSFQKADIFHYGDLLSGSDIVLSVGSTVAIESVTLGTPFLHLKFDDKPREYGESVRRFYDYEHMSYLLSFPAYEVADSSEQAIALIEKYLEDPDRLLKERSEAIEKINYKLDGGAGKRIAKLIGDYST